MTMKHFGLRIDEERLKKLRYVADYEGRSINQHVLVLIWENICAFEKKYGIIEIE